MMTARKRMALFPATETEVIHCSPNLWVPVVRVAGRVCILPGVPRLFEGLLDALEKYIPIDPVSCFSWAERLGGVVRLTQTHTEPPASVSHAHSHQVAGEQHQSCELFCCMICCCLRLLTLLPSSSLSS